MPCLLAGWGKETREIRTSDLESDALPLRHSPLRAQWKRLDLQMAKKAGGIWRQKCQGFTGRLVRKRRFREEKHGPHRLVVRMSRCGRSNLGSNPSVGILEQTWNCLAKAASLLQGCGHEDLRDTLAPAVEEANNWSHSWSERMANNHKVSGSSPDGTTCSCCGERRKESAGAEGVVSSFGLL